MDFWAITGVIVDYVLRAVSAFALIFAVSSWWWVNRRQGHLRITTPRSYALGRTPANTIVLHLPLIFLNDGPLPIVVQNLQVKITGQHSGKPTIVPFVATRAKLGAVRKDEDDGRNFATQFVVSGRE